MECTQDLTTFHICSFPGSCYRISPEWCPGIFTGLLASALPPAASCPTVLFFIIGQAPISPSPALFCSLQPRWPAALPLGCAGRGVGATFGPLHMLCPVWKVFPIICIDYFLTSGVSGPKSPSQEAFLDGLFSVCRLCTTPPLSILCNTYHHLIQILFTCWLPVSPCPHQLPKGRTLPVLSVAVAPFYPLTYSKCSKHIWMTGTFISGFQREQLEV